MLNRANQVAQDLGNQISDLANLKVPAYMVGSAASMLFGLSYIANKLNFGEFSNYVSMAGLVLTATVAVREYGVQESYKAASIGIQETYKAASSGMLTLFNYVKPMVSKPPIDDLEVEAVAKKTM